MQGGPHNIRYLVCWLREAIVGRLQVAVALYSVAPSEEKTRMGGLFTHTNHGHGALLCLKQGTCVF